MKPRATAALATPALLLAGLLVAAAALAEGRAPAGHELERVVEKLRQAAASDAGAATELGHALRRLGRLEAAKAAYRRAIELAPARSFAYAALADLGAEDPQRLKERDQLEALLERGLERVGGGPGAVQLVLSVANFERSVGRTDQARARLERLDRAPLSPEQRRRLLELEDAIAVEEQGRALADWPEPEVPAALKREVAEAERAFDRGDIEAALESATRLEHSQPAWRRPRWLRARGYEALGHWDEAARELSILVQLEPSHAAAWRRLGRILAHHGGALDAARADEALRQALALEPAFWDLWLARAQVAVRQGRRDEAERALARYLREAPEQATTPEVLQLRVQARALAARLPRASDLHLERPSPRAQELYRRARDWLAVGDPLGLAPDLLASALEDSPAFVDAAAAAFASNGQVPAPTIEGLWDDGEALLRLASKLRALGRGKQTDALVLPWLDQAIELGVLGASFERALVRLGAGERAGALADLLFYVAAEPRPDKLDEARVLLASLAPPPLDMAPLKARVRLLSDSPAQAAEALGARCEAATPAERVEALGRVHEWSGDVAAALGCYRELVRRDPSHPEPLRRLAGVAARAPVVLAGQVVPELERAAALELPIADWALARLALARTDGRAALPHLTRFLARADLDDPARPLAVAARATLERSSAQAARARTLRRTAALAAGAIFLVSVMLALFHGQPVERALARQPALFPEVARTIGELRHDLLKHRLSVLGMAACGGAAREKVAQALLEPRRTSLVVAAAYGELRRAARIRGVTLRRLGREPVFGPLVGDLRRAEALVMGEGRADALARVDARLRQLHAERLAALERLAPRTRLDAAFLTEWIGRVEAETRARQARFIPPALHLQGLGLDFPVEQVALGLVFANLLRNAESAVAEQGEAARVLVRAGAERDAAGRRVLMLVVGDSAERTLTLEQIETRESGRGLAIVRNLVHEWHGHVVIRTEPAPYRKVVGACFPA